MGLMPHERSLVEEMKDRPFAFLGINLDESPEVMKAVVKEAEVPGRNVNDDDRSISRQWRARLLPAIYVIDHKGVVRYEHRVDKEPPSRLERKVRELVKEAEADAAKEG